MFCIGRKGIGVPCCTTADYPPVRRAAMMTMRQRRTVVGIGSHPSQNCRCLMVSPVSGAHFCSSFEKWPRLDSGPRKRREIPY